ncbi:MAG: hypothetical protein ABUJ92_00485 [Desulfobacterales bacterium]
MAEEEEVIVNEEIVEVVVEDEAQEEVAEPDEEAGEEVTEVEEEESDAMVVTIGDDEPEEQEEANAPAWVKEVRQKNRELNKELKELRRQTEVAAQPGYIVVGKEPEMDDPDIDYDTEEFKVKWAAWAERTRQAEAAADNVKAAQTAEAEAWQATSNTYIEKRNEVKAKFTDYDDAEEVVRETLSNEQQSIIMHIASNSANVVLALGKNPAKAAQLAGIKDNLKFTAAIALLERDINMGKRKPASAPEKKVSGSGTFSGTSTAKLERLEADADKTGDRTKLQAYKRGLQKKA